MSRAEHCREALRNFVPPGLKKGETYTLEDLRPYFSTLVDMANKDREFFIQMSEKMGERVRHSLRTPITESEIEQAASLYDHWVSLHDT